MIAGGALLTGVTLRDGSLRSSMRLFFEVPAWRLKKPLAELMAGKAWLFPAAVSLRLIPVTSAQLTSPAF
jgi:hypothetical protein